MDSQRKVSKDDRTYMARDVKPLLTDLLSDVVRARPRAPVDFSIAWLASRRAQATDVPAPKSVSKLRDAISFDAAVTSQKPTTCLEKKRIFVLGDVSSGKTTLLKAMQGDLEPAAKPSGGFKTFDLGHQLSEDAPQSTLTFFDVSGKAKARARWPAYFSDCHAVVFVVDCSSDLSEARTCFDYCFRATNEHEDERRSMLKGKPLLVLANKQDLEDSAKPDEVSKALDLDAYQRDGYHVAVCPVVGDPQKSNGALDPRVERAVDWLAQKIDDKAGALEARRTRETAATDAWDALQKEKKEQRVFRKVLRKAHPVEGEPEECMSEAEGLEFFASELGCTIENMDPTAKRLAALMNYQKLALQMTAAMNQPVNPKKRAPKSWDEVAAYVEARNAEKWDPAVVQRDEDEDPTSMKNRMAKRQ
jgi:small GTP-binding protein